MDEIQDISERKRKMQEFKDRLGRPVTQEEREAIMGITSDLDKFKIERDIILAQLEQLRMEEGALRELREIGGILPTLVRSGRYNRELAAGMFNGQTTAQVVFHYLMKERQSWPTQLRHLFGRGAW